VSRRPEYCEGQANLFSGDVHLAAVGQFYSNPKLGLAKHKDFRYIPNVISSAIVNTPPPDLLADVLNKRNKVHHFDKETDEDMIPIFAHGVDGKPRNNKHLLPHRNWCAIREYVPGHTPPPTPSHSAYDLTPLGSPPSTADGALGRRSSLFRRLSRSKTTDPDVGPKDRTRPPVSGGLLRSLSRRAGAASADQVGQPKPGFLTRTLSGSSVSGRFGGLFRRRSGTARRDDGGINGVWGPDTDEEEGYQNQYQQQHPHPYEQYSHTHSRGGAASGGGDWGVGLRGGLGPNEYVHGGGYNSEFDQGDESFFSVKPHPSHTPGPPVPPKPVMPGAVTFAQQEHPHHQQPHHHHQPQHEKGQEEEEFTPKPFHRTPTGLSAKQLRGKNAADYEVNLQGALEVTLNVEISPRDPGGSTVPYRLVVPRLWYEYEGEEGDEMAGGEVMGRGREGEGVGFGEKVGMREMGEGMGGSVGAGEEKKGIKRLLSLRRGG
jgi:hypothetical protein